MILCSEREREREKPGDVNAEMKAVIKAKRRNRKMWV